MLLTIGGYLTLPLNKGSHESAIRNRSRTFGWDKEFHGDRDDWLEMKLEVDQVMCVDLHHRYPRVQIFTKGGTKQ
jgi:hypothetical protein